MVDPRGHSKMMWRKEVGEMGMSENVAMYDCFLTARRGFLVSLTSFNLKTQTKGYWIGNFLWSLYKIQKY